MEIVSVKVGRKNSGSDFYHSKEQMSREGFLLESLIEQSIVVIL